MTIFFKKNSYLVLRSGKFGNLVTSFFFYRSSNALFDLIWHSDGSVSLRANNGKYVITKRSGHLYATCEHLDETAKYYFYLINRPVLVLKCDQGFVGYKSVSSPKLECNKVTYETIKVERHDRGIVFLKGI